MDGAYPPGEGGMLSVIGFQMAEVEETISGFAGRLRREPSVGHADSDFGKDRGPVEAERTL